MRLQHFCALAGGLSRLTAAQSLGSTLATHNSFSILYDALDYLGLLDELNSARDATYFAPDNDALKYLADFGINLTTTDPTIARALIFYGLVDGIHSSNSVSKSGNVQLIHSELYPPLFTNVTEGQALKLATNKTESKPSIVLETGLQILTQVTESDIAFDYGLIHGTSTNMVLPHNVSETLRLGQLPEFLDLMRKSSIEAELNSLADMTLFVPHNEAISKLHPLLDTMTQKQLAEIVSHHAVVNNVLYESKVGKSVRSLETVGGGTVQVRRDSQGEVYVNNVKVVRKDVLLYGGVAHIIDGVLFPEQGTSSSRGIAIIAIFVTFGSQISRVASQWIASRHGGLILGLLGLLAIIAIPVRLYRQRRSKNANKNDQRKSTWSSQKMPLLGEVEMEKSDLC